jgi:hypothetical protein
VDVYWRDWPLTTSLKNIAEGIVQANELLGLAAEDIKVTSQSAMR